MRRNRLIDYDGHFSRLYKAACSAQATDRFIAEAVGELASKVIKLVPNSVRHIRVGRWDFEGPYFTNIPLGNSFSDLVGYKIGDRCHYGMEPEDIRARRAFLRRLPKLLTKIEQRTGQHVAKQLNTVAILDRVTAPAPAEMAH